jgi:hypothetical protein
MTVAFRYLAPIDYIVDSLFFTLFLFFCMVGTCTEDNSTFGDRATMYCAVTELTHIS